MLRLIGYFFGIGTVFALMVAAGVALYVKSLSDDIPDYDIANASGPLRFRGIWYPCLNLGLDASGALTPQSYWDGPPIRS